MVCVDRWRYYAITHGDHVICNATSPERLDEIIGLLDLAPGARVWEAASGKGELLIRLTERYGVAGVGVDASPFEIAVVPGAGLRPGPRRGHPVHRRRCGCAHA